MPERLLDVHLAFDPRALARTKNPTRTIAEAHRAEAERQASENRGSLRHPDPIEITKREGRDPLTGDDVLLVGTRWVVDTLG